MNIWAKRNGITLRNHIECLLNQAVKLRSSVPILGNLFKLLKYAIILHDIGKVSPSFQMAVGNWEYEPRVPFPNVPHSIFSLVWIDEGNLKREFNNSKDDIRILLSSVAFHHWRARFDSIILGEDKDVQRAMEELSVNSELADELLDNLKKELSNYSTLIHYNRKLVEIIRKGYDILNYIVPPYKNYSLPGHLRFDESTKKKFILVSGFLMRIDHFASYLQQETQNNCVGEDIEITPVNYNVVEKKIIEKVGTHLWQIEKLKNDRDKNLILVAPTGSGKSEFVFLWGADDKLIFTLPLRSAVNAMFERAKTIFGEGKVGLLHSDADVYLYERTGYEGERMRVLDLARHLAYPVLITTGDQIFPSALKYPGYEKIYATLSYSKLVVDEVQAYDPRAIATIIKLLEDMEKLGGKFLLMTATLPNFVRNELKVRIENIEEIDIYENYTNVSKHKIKIRKGDLLEEVEEVLNKAEEGKRVLVIFNTVEKAQIFYNKLRGKLSSSGNNVYLKLLHSRFTLEDRKNIEKEIIKEFSNPKPKDESEPKILVATQVVEASLDIDADLLYTELAPIDALIQRMGRVMRRCREGKCIDENSPPNVYVFYENFYEEDKQIVSGAGRVYLNELLYLSLVLLILKGNTNSQQEFEGEVEEFKEKAKKSKKMRDETIKIIKNNIFKDIALSESDKKDLIEKLYDKDTLSKYFDKFYDTLSVLDAGFVSEYKEEALRIFREIYSIPVIPRERIEELKEHIREFIGNSHNKSYTSFKSNVLSKFVVYVDLRYLGDKSLIKVSSAIGDLVIEDRNLANKFLGWLSDVYLIYAKYDKDVGLEMGSEITYDNII
ncbi:MAG: CRISPR-associated helicase Cas3' [Candidatus Omnitrophica bacterium]|nr:CRISPR-associated helicase Cas3' [Candidatus Omnitrophota bacterium]